VQHLHADIRRLTALAFPKLEDRARETVACDYFVDALNDPTFELKVRERAPRRLDAAYKESLNLEMWQQCQRAIYFWSDTVFRPNSTEYKKEKTLRKVQNPKETSSEHKHAGLLMKRIAELEQKLQTALIQAPPLLRGATVRSPRPSLQPRIPFQFTRLMQSERKPHPLAAVTRSYGCWGCGATNQIL